MYDLTIVGAGPSAYAFLKGLEKNSTYKNKKIALVFPKNSHESTLPVSVTDVSPKFLQKKNLLSLSYYLDTLGNFVQNNFTNLGVHGIGGMARIWGGSFGIFTESDLNRNNMSYKKFNDTYKDMEEFLPFSGNEKDLMYESILKCSKSVKLSNKIKSFFGKWVGKRVLVGFPRLLVKTSCDNCNQCLSGCHNDSIWYPTKEDFQKIQNISLVLYDNHIVSQILDNSIVCKKNNTIEQEIESKKIILATGAIQTYLLLAKKLRSKENKAKLYVTPAMAFAFFTFRKNKNKDFFGMGNATFEFKNEKNKVSFYGNLYDGYSLSISKGKVFSKNKIKDTIFKLVSRYLVAGAGFSSSDNASVVLNYDSENKLFINAQYTDRYSKAMEKNLQSLKLFIKESGSYLVHKKFTNLGADIHYAGGIPDILFDKDLIVKGELKGLENILVVGGSNFTYLPPQSPTLSFMTSAYIIGKELEVQTG